MRIAVAVGLVALFPAMAYAYVEPQDKYLDLNCRMTPGIPWKTDTQADKTPAKGKKKARREREEPMLPGENYLSSGEVVPSNKLALPAGKSIYAAGELVYISGRVLDRNCVPVSDAIIDIWQTNPEGRYVRSTLGERLSPAPVFAGSGRATTDNLGRFNFVTVFPGAPAGRAPFIHFRVVHKDFPTLNTEMFFADDRRNAGDPVYSSLSHSQRPLATARVWQRDANDPGKGLGAMWDIVLTGKNPWRHF